MLQNKYILGSIVMDRTDQDKSKYYFYYKLNWPIKHNIDCLGFTLICETVRTSTAFPDLVSKEKLEIIFSDLTNSKGWKIQAPKGTVHHRVKGSIPLRFLGLKVVYPLAALPKLTGTFSRFMESCHQLNLKQLISSLNEYSCVLEVSSINTVTEWKM